VETCFELTGISEPGPGASSVWLAVLDVVACGKGRNDWVAAWLTKKKRRQSIGCPLVERTEKPSLMPAP